MAEERHHLSLKAEEAHNIVNDDRNDTSTSNNKKNSNKKKNSSSRNTSNNTNTSGQLFL